LKKRLIQTFFGKKSCFQPRILQKKHIYYLICALIRGELMHYEEEEEDWKDEDEEDDNWRDDE